MSSLCINIRLFLISSFLLFGGILYGQSEKNIEIVPSKLKSDKNYLAGEKILLDLEDSISINRNLNESILGWYRAPFRKEFQLNSTAKHAQIEFEECLENQVAGSSEYAKCLSKIALCEHFQVTDFSHSDSLSKMYKSSIEKINQAISIQKKNADSKLLMQLYYTAVQISIPHIQWGFQSLNAARAEEIAFDYLYHIAEIYENDQNYKKEIEALRFITSQSVGHLLRKVEVSIKAGEQNKVPFAYDVREFIHHFVYKQEKVPDYKTEIEQYGQAAIETFDRTKNLVPHIDYYVSLLSDLALCYKVLDAGFERSRGLLQKAEELLIKTNKSNYYIAFQLGAIHIQEGNFDEAEAQYRLALKNEKLSPTDTQHAWFGLVIISEIQGDLKTADATWKSNIGDREIMNGISSFQYGFANDFKPIIKEKALAVMKRMNAKNAIRIVKEGWV